MKMKLFTKVILVLLIFLANKPYSSFSQCVELGMSGVPSGVTVLGVRAVSSSGTIQNFTYTSGKWVHSPISGNNWFLQVKLQITGTFGAILHQQNVPTNDYMSYPGSSGTAWYAVWDGFFNLNSCSQNKIYFCASATGGSNCTF